MKQNILRKLMLIAVLLTYSHVFANHIEVDGIYYNYTSDNLTVGVTYKGDNPESYSDEYTGNVVIPESITYRDKEYSVTSIRSEAFRGCANLNSVTIPKSITRIENEAFNECTSLKELIFEDGESELWLGYNRYESSGTGDGMFDDCYRIESIYLGRDIDYRTESDYGYSPFYNISGLKTLIISNSVTDIPNSAFQECHNLTKITIPNSVINIGNSAFSNCSNLIELIFGNSVVSIDNWAFYGCESLTSLTIPNSITKLGYGVFSKCTGLTEIINEATIPQAINDGTFQYVPTTTTLYVPVGSKQAYANATGWSRFTNIVEKEMSGVESTLADDDVAVSVEDGNIVINGTADNVNVEVYSMNGQCVYCSNATTIPITVKGLYLVKVNNKSFKIIL